jgi:inorganic triphosphatase YgiF
MTDPTEIELKLEFDPASRERLNATEPLTGAEGRTEHLITTYFDTPDRQIWKAGYSVRIRRKGGKRIQTIKAMGGAGLFARGEWEREVDGDTPVLDTAGNVPTLAIDPKVLGRTGEIFATDVLRTARTIDDGKARFECAIDEGEIRAGRHKLTLNEIELEMKDGSPRSLFDFARRLDADVPLRLGVASKAERGYRLAGGTIDQPVKAEAIHLDPTGNAADGFCAIVRSCLRQFRLNETILLETGAAEPLHQARVGLRRLRTAFSLHESLLAGDTRAELFDAELRWLATELGEARNLDVLIPRAGRKWREPLGLAREHAFERVRADLASARTRLLMIDLAEWLEFGDWRLQPRDPALPRIDATQFAGDLLQASRKKLKHRGKNIPALDDPHRHKARIAAKKLRYASEFFASLYRTKKAADRREAFVEKLEELQDHLGKLNDLAVGQRLLARLGIDTKLQDAGKGAREDLLERAGEAYRALMKARRFWR